MSLAMCNCHSWPLDASSNVQLPCLPTRCTVAMWIIWLFQIGSWPRNEHFPIYLLGNPINMCWNHQYRPQFSETMPCSEDSNTYLWSFQEDRWENVHFLVKSLFETVRWFTLLLASSVQEWQLDSYIPVKRSFVYRSSPGGSLIFPCPDCFVQFCEPTGA